MAKQYKLRFKPTPISRLLKRPTTPFQMVGYPYASNWTAYYALNYRQMIHEKRNPPMTRERALECYGPAQDGIF